MKTLLRGLNARNLALLVIAAPILVCALYLYAFSADRYVSESVVTVKQSGDQPVGLAGLASIFQVSGASAHSDLLLLQSHILSMDMLQLLDKRLGLRQAYSAPNWDVLLKLAPDASADEFLRYYRNRVEARLDDTTGLLTLRTQGFTADQAQAINQAIIESSEVFINGISQKLAQDQMGFAAAEMDKATARLHAAKRKMFAFQESNRMLDPAAQAAASSQMTLELQARLSRLEADHRAARAYMDENAYQVRALKVQIDAVREQMAVEASRGTSETKSSPRLNTLAGEYREVQIEMNFAEEAYKSTILSMETARLETTRKIKTLVKVASPTRPEDAEYPRRAYDLIAVLLGLCLIYGIVRLMIATIEDHLD